MTKDRKKYLEDKQKWLASKGKNLGKGQLLELNKLLTAEQGSVNLNENGHKRSKKTTGNIYQ